MLTWEFDEKKYRLALFHTLDCHAILLANFVLNWHQQFLLNLRDQYNIEHHNQFYYLSHYLKVDSIVLHQSLFKSKALGRFVHIIKLRPGLDGGSILLGYANLMDQWHGLRFFIYAVYSLRFLKPRGGGEKRIKPA